MIIYVTGIPRSGSTWCYNVARLAMWMKHGSDRVSCGFATAPENDHSVIKTHDFIADRPSDAMVIHSTRDYVEAATSWQSFTPSRKEPAITPEQMQAWDFSWRPCCDVLIHRRWLDNRASRVCAVHTITARIGLTYRQAEVVSSQVDATVPPETGLDPVTMLRANHMKSR